MNNNKKNNQDVPNPLFLKIFQTFRIAIQPKSLIIALMAVIVIFLAGWLMDISDTVVTTSDGTNELQIYLNNPAQLSHFIKTNKQLGCDYSGVFSTMWHFAAAKFNGAVISLLQLNLQQFSLEVTEYCRAVKWACRYHTIYCVILGLIKLSIIAIAGGAICRIASLLFARGEKPGLFQALRFSTKKFFSFFAAPLIPLAIIIVVGILIFLLGLIANIPFIGELIMGISIPLALVAGTLITIIAIGAIAGFNLMFPAVAYDGSDCFDAISRSMSYIYAKPWHMGFYSAAALIYGAICYIFVRFFAFLLLFITHLFLAIGVFTDSSGKEADKLSAIWPESSFTTLVGPLSFTNTNFSESIAAFLVYICLLLIVGLVIAFVISFYFSANTIIYSLMRNRVDGTDLEEIYTYYEDTDVLMEAEKQNPDKAESEPNTAQAGSEKNNPE